MNSLFMSRKQPIPKGHVQNMHYIDSVHLNNFLQSLNWIWAEKLLKYLTHYHVSCMTDI